MSNFTRRSQKIINLRAKNKEWSNDNNKFGQRMLEKMGWSSGKGLGAKEDGIVEPVVARYKNDDKGLGYKENNDLSTKSGEDFDALLASLAQPGSSSEEKLHSGVSLEVKSKESKSRIHYSKLTRGKDLSRYSEKDLANILGKKNLKKKEIDQKMGEVVEICDQVLNENLQNMEVYFKARLIAIREKVNLAKTFNNCENRLEGEGKGTEYSFQGFSQTPEAKSEDDSRKRKVTTDEEVITDHTYKVEMNDDIPEKKTKTSDEQNTDVCIKKKKKKKSKQ